jgi:hypothetical protein
MGITLSICTLSKKREAMLREDPSLVWELSRKVPGYLDMDKAWDALRVAVSAFDADTVTKLFGGELGKSFGEPGAFSKPRIVANDELARVARAMADVPPRFVRDQIDTLRGKSVHGAYFEDEPGDDDLRGLEATFERVRELITQAANRGDALLLVFR